MCICSSVLRLKPFLEEAWARKVWKMSLLRRVVRGKLEWALFHWTTKFCSQRPFVCIPKITCNILLSWETSVEENVVIYAHPAMNFLGGSWGVVSFIQEILILSPYVTELVNLLVCDLQCLTSHYIVLLAGLTQRMECIWVKVRIWWVAIFLKMVS